jgi:hypothetical protein
MLYDIIILRFVWRRQAGAALGGGKDGQDAVDR